MQTRKLKAGDWVEVRSEQEILCTLDQNGRLDGMPFMPEMLAFCERRFQIFKVAHKTCDSASQTTRRLQDTFHLATRCSGGAHGGCHAGCLLFWKGAWLRTIGSPDTLPSTAAEHLSLTAQPTCTKDDLKAATQSQLTGRSMRYHCQATELHTASTPLPWWDLRPYFEDVRSGNVTAWQQMLGVVRLTLIRAGALPFLVGRAFQLLYRALALFDEQKPFPFLSGSIPSGARTPTQSLGLARKDRVHVKLCGEIITTLDSTGRNRGLAFDPEQVPYIGQEHAVSHRIERIMDENSGQLVQINSPTVALEDVVCQGKYGRCRLSCPRSTLLFWREIWLERSPSNSDTGVPS